MYMSSLSLLMSSLYLSGEYWSDFLVQMPPYIKYLPDLSLGVPGYSTAQAYKR